MKISESVHIEAQIDKVFDLFTDLDEIEKIIPGIKSIEILEGPKKMQKGTRWKETRVMFGKEASEEMVVSGFKVNDRYIADATSSRTPEPSISVC